MRKLSQKVISQINDQDVDGVYIWLLEVSHDSFETLYFTNDNVNHIVNAKEYIAFPFTLRLAKDGEDAMPQAKLSISNVGLDLIDRIRSVTNALTFSIRLVLADDPADVQIEIPTMIGRGVGYDDTAIEYTLVYDDILSVQVPSHSYNPIEYGGLF